MYVMQHLDELYTGMINNISDCQNITAYLQLQIAVKYRVAPKKVSHYQESSLNRIKNCQCGYISHQFGV